MSDKLIKLIISLQDQASAGIEKLNGSLGQMASVAGGTLLAGAIQAAGQAVVGLGAATISTAADFQNATATFASVAGGALADAGFAMEDVTAKALDLGATTAYSAGEAQQAMIELAKGGVPIVDVMGNATDATLALAAAGEVGLANAAEIVAAQLGVWASEGVTAAQVSDTLAQAANASVVGVEELALGLAQVGGVAKVAGVSFQDINQTMALIAPGFGSASDAGTSLKGVLLGMTPATSAAKAQFHELGLMAFDAGEAAAAMGIDISKSGDPLEEIDAAMRKFITSTMGIKQGTEAFDKAYGELYSQFEYSKFYDAQGSFLGMENAASLLQGAMAGMGQDAQAAALKVMFGTDSFRAAAFLAEAGAAGFNEMGLAMDAAGSAAEQAAIRQQTFKFAWDSLKGSIETIMIVIGSALLPILTSLVNDHLIPAANSVLSFAQAILSSATPWQTFIDGLNQVLPGLGTFVGFVAGNIIPILIGFGSAILAVIVPALYTMAAAAIAPAIAMAPITIAILAIGAAAALLAMAWQNNWGGIQEKTAAVWAFIQPFLAQLVAWVGEMLPVAVAALAQLWTGTLWPALQLVGAFIMSALVPALVAAGGWLATNIPIAIAAAVAAFNTIVSVLTTVVGAVTSFAASLSATVSDIATRVQAGWALVASTTSAAWAALVATVQGFVERLVAEISARVGVIGTVIAAAWNTVATLTSAAWGIISSIVGAAIGAVAGVVGPHVAQVVSVLSAGWEFIKGVTSAAWAFVSSYVASQVATTAAALTTAWANIQAVTAVAWAAVQMAVSVAIGVIVAVISSVVSTILAVWTGAMTGAQTSASAAWENIKTVITGVVQIIQTVISTGLGVVRTLMAAGWSLITAAANNEFSKIPGIITGVWDKVKSAISAGVGAIKAIASQLNSAAQELGKNIVSGILSGVSSMASSLSSKLKDMAKGALNAAKSALGISSPSKVFAEGVGVPIVDGIVLGLAKAAPKATSAMLDLAGKLVDLVGKGVDAFGKLRDLGSISFGAVSSFVNTLQDTMTLFGEMTLKWDRGMMSAAGQFTGKSATVVEFMSKGIDFLLKLQEYEGVPQAVITSFANNLSQAISELIRISTWEMRLALTAAVEFSNGAGKAIGILSAGVDGLNKLRNLADAVPGSFAKFATYIAVLVTRITEVSAYIDGAGVAAAGRFSEGAGKAIGLLSAGVDGLTKLGTLGAAVPGMFQSFAIQIFALVLRISEVAGWISADGVARAAAFSDGAGKVIGLIGAGVDGFAKLRGFGAVAAAPIQLFVQAVMGLLAQFALTASFMAADAVNHAGVFADAAGKVIGLLGAGVDGFAKLALVKEVPLAAMVLFVEMVRRIVAITKNTAIGFEAEGLAAAGLFSDAAAKVLGVIVNGVAGLNGLSKLGPVSQASIDAFAAGVHVTMQRLAAAAAQFSASALAHAGLFADSAGKAVNILKNGVEGLMLVNTFTGASDAAITRFGDGVRLAVAKMAALAVEFGVDATAAASAFANAAGQSTDFLKKGVEGFAKLAELDAVPQAAMDLFAAGVISLIRTIIALSAVLTTDALAQANSFANAIDLVIQVVLSGLKALGDLGSRAGDIKLFTDSLVAQVARLAAALATEATPAAENIGLNIAYGIANGLSAGTPAIQNAVYAAVNAALAAARAALGIASPSKVFDQIGQFSGAGLARGMEAATPIVSAAASGMAAASLAPVAAAASTPTTPRGGGGGSNSTSTMVVEKGAITIVQQPGESGDLLAQRVMKLVEQKYKLRG